MLDQLKRIEPKGRSPDQIRRLKIIFGAVVVVLVIIILFLAYQLYQSRDAESQRDDALQTARRFGVHISSISHSTIERDIEEIRSVSTAEFHTEFERATGGAAYQQSVRDLEATSSGKVRSAVLESLEGDSAKAVVIVEVTSQNKTLERPKVETRRIQISLKRTGSGWRVDHLESAVSVEP